MTKNFAAIDIGSNSSRLLITDENAHHLLLETQPVKLGDGMHETSMISKESFARAVKCFEDFRTFMDKYEVSEYRAIATAACRKAKNSDKLLQAIKEHSNIDLEIIDGYEEAILNLKGALLNADKNKKYAVVFDIGGGSTEITLATNSKDPEIIYTISIPWGARNAMEAFGFSAYDEKKALKLHSKTAEYVKDFIEKSNYKKYAEDVCVIATSSMPLRLAAMQYNFKEYIREKSDGLVIDMTKIDKIWNKINKMTVAEMAIYPLIGTTRADISIPGYVIFTTITNYLHAEKITASLKNAKDGIIMDLVNKYK